MAATKVVILTTSFAVNDGNSDMTFAAYTALSDTTADELQDWL